MHRSETQIIEYVTDYADQAHAIQVRKYTGDKYIVHPVKVMETLRALHYDVPVLCAALLHDVLEDTAVSSGDMAEALRVVMDEQQVKKTISLVVELTDVFVKANYPGLNRRSRKEREANRLAGVSSEAQSIKYADILDNVNDLVSHDADFAKKYLSEAKKMLDVMTKGNPVLRERAMRMVEQSTRALRPQTLS